MGGFRWPLTNGSAIDSIAPQRRTASYTILSRTCHVTRGIFLLSRAPCGTRGQRLLLVSPLLMTIFAGAPGTTRTCDLRFRGPINAFADVSQRLPSRWSPSATPSFDVPHPLARGAHMHFSCVARSLVSGPLCADVTTPQMKQRIESLPRSAMRLVCGLSL